MAGKKDREKRQIRYTSAKSWAERNDGGGESTCVRLPEGVPFFNIKRLGTYKVDILPFVAGEGNPHSDKGYIHYERTFEQHYLPTGKPYCCPNNWGKPCPVCKWCLLNKNAADPTNRALSAQCRAKTRILWVLYDLTNEESKQKGMQVWETGDYKSFGETIKNKILALDEYENFFHLDGGYTLVLSVVEDSFTVGTVKKPYNKVGNIEMIPRKKPYPEELLDEVPCLDNCLVQIPPKQLEKIFLTAIGEAEEEEDTPEVLPRGTKFLDDEVEGNGDAEEEIDDEVDDAETLFVPEEGDVVHHPKHGKSTVIKKRANGTISLRPDGSNTVVTGIDPGECSRWEESEDDEEGTPEADDEDEDALDFDDEGEEPEEETPPPTKRGRK